MSAARRRAAVTLHDVSLAIEGPEDAVEHLEALFGLASRAGTEAAQAHVLLELGEPRLALPQRALADQIVQRGAVFSVGATTWVRHHGWAVSRYDFAAERGHIVAARADDLVELGYLMVLSRAGALLERRGLVRVHAAAFERHGRGALFLAPSGGGKSTLVQRLLGEPDVRILGDDVGLLDRRGRLHGWPTSVGVRDADAARGLGRLRAFSRRFHGLKHVIDSRDLAARFTPGPAPLERVYLGRWASGPPSRLRPASARERAAALSSELIVGAGLPQVVELVIPRGARDAPGQWRSLARRLRAAARVLKGARALTVEAHDADALARLVIDDVATA